MSNTIQHDSHADWFVDTFKQAMSCQGTVEVCWRCLLSIVSWICAQIEPERARTTFCYFFWMPERRTLFWHFLPMLIFLWCL